MLCGLWHLTKEVVVEPLHKSRITVVLISRNSNTLSYGILFSYYVYESSKRMQELPKVCKSWPGLCIVNCTISGRLKKVTRLHHVGCSKHDSLTEANYRYLSLDSNVPNCKIIGHCYLLNHASWVPVIVDVQVSLLCSWEGKYQILLAAIRSYVRTEILEDGQVFKNTA